MRIEHKLFKRIIALLLVLSSVTFTAAANSLSVPLDSDAYRIIDVAEARGIIPDQSDVRPYAADKVVKLLEEIILSDKITAGERKAAESVLLDLERSSNISDENSILHNGYYAFSFKNTAVAMGAKASSEQTVGIKDKAIDSRNTLTVFLKGEVFNTFDFYMDLEMLFNKLDHRAFLVTDFKDNCDGFYMTSKKAGAGTTYSPFSRIVFGTAMLPELSASFFDDALTVRFASIERDWGPGINNLALSKSARSFDAFEFTLSPAEWMSFSVAVGALGKSYIVMEGESAVPGTGSDSDYYDNNFSIQRIEVEPFEGFRASIYESVVYKKRFELAYLNPLGVYMFSQNYIGDFDNMLIGLDGSYTWKGVGKFYAGVAIDEMHSYKPFHSRNILSWQAGGTFSIPYGDFSSLTLQTTYVGPFFGTHYTYKEKYNPWGSLPMGTAYVNKGATLGYPLYPDSLELLLSFSTTISSFDLSLDFIAKDQMRSAQYSLDESGTNLKTIFNYYYYDNEAEYEDRKFFSYIWNNTLDLEVKAKKSFDSFPFDLNLGLQCIIETNRSFTVDATPETTYDKVNEGGTEDKMSTNPGNRTTMGSDWSTSLKFNFSVGFSVYY